jgi:hypothetical protein
MRYSLCDSVVLVTIYAGMVLLHRNPCPVGFVALRVSELIAFQGDLVSMCWWRCGHNSEYAR